MTHQASSLTGPSGPSVEHMVASSVPLLALRNQTLWLVVSLANLLEQVLQPSGHILFFCKMPNRQQRRMHNKTLHLHEQEQWLMLPT